MVAQNPSQSHQEGHPEIDRGFLVGDPLDAPALVHQVEEGPDIVPEDPRADLVHDPLKTNCQIRDLIGTTRSDVTHKRSGRLQQGHSSQELASRHPLTPADPVFEDECPVVTEAPKCLEGSIVMTHVTRQDIRGQPGPQQVENPEPVSLPGLIRPEVDSGTQPRPLECTCIDQGPCDRSPHRTPGRAVLLLTDHPFDRPLGPSCCRLPCFLLLPYPAHVRGVELRIARSCIILRSEKIVKSFYCKKITREAEKKMDDTTRASILSSSPPPGLGSG